METGTIYAVAGAKGGVGKTTTSINLAAAVAATSRSVVVVELELAMANLADFLALDVDPAADTTLHDVPAGEAAVSDAVYDAPAASLSHRAGRRSTALQGLTSTASARRS